MRRGWYALHTLSNHEYKVKAHLERVVEAYDLDRKVFCVLVPTREEVEFRRGERRVVRKKIFPGYVFVQMEMDNQSWYLVQRTYGVTGFVGAGSEPEPLDDEEINRILLKASGKTPLVEEGSWQVGQSVQVKWGPFAHFVGKVADLNLERGKAKVLLSIFSRETPVQLDFAQLEKI